MNSSFIITSMIISVAYLSLCDGNDPTITSEPMITIQYPAALLEYYNFVAKLPRNSKESAWNYNKTTLEDLCVASVESKFFLYVEENMKVSSPALDRQTTWIKQWQDDTRKQFAAVNFVDEDSVRQIIPLMSINIPEIPEMLQVMPCYVKKGAGWFIAVLFNSDTYFSVSRASARAPYVLNGLFEPYPIINEELSNDQEKLEEAFQKGHSSEVGGKRTLLNLAPFELMRVCSGIYVVWSKQKNINVRSSNTFRMPDGGVSIVWQAKIDLPHIMSTDSFFAKVFVEANLITCTINAEWEKPQFYVTADQNTLGGAYVIVQNEKKGFSVFMHVTEIIALKQRE